MNKDFKVDIEDVKNHLLQFQTRHNERAEDLMKCLERLAVVYNGSKQGKLMKYLRKRLAVLLADVKCVVTTILEEEICNVADDNCIDARQYSEELTDAIIELSEFCQDYDQSINESLVKIDDGTEVWTRWQGWSMLSLLKHAFVSLNYLVRDQITILIDELNVIISKLLQS